MNRSTNYTKYEPQIPVPTSLVSRRIAVCSNIAKLRCLLNCYERMSKNMNTVEMENLQDEMIPIIMRLAVAIEVQKYDADAFQSVIKNISER